ncbi:uncharacterized protein LOC126705223 [Quercus robur]|uniref:uncharacterized protein LOC126705223 n=1 Tax=Quercus robur TaxID=38942 RepID=UPI0021611C26|nr:uncharacterized protein LOC126705223 [Quercus robur]
MSDKDLQSYWNLDIGCLLIECSKAIIVKLVGKSVGLNYLHSKLSQLWKPSGRLDCVDLGNNFFLTRFYVKEDLDNVLRNGPWFIVDHFLSLRPWEPFFKPSSASFSLIAVWIRLYELPIELYEADILRPIGEAIGKVLRIDSHTAMEARGKYARLCVQIDVNKPLVNTILIGKFEQVVSYEGIHKLCFACGRVGHRQEACPYVIHRGKPPVAAEEVNKDGLEVRSHNLHEACVSGKSHAMPKVSGAEDIEGQYGPWMVVTRKKQIQKGTKKGSAPEGSTRSAWNSTHAQAAEGVSNATILKSQPTARPVDRPNGIGLKAHSGMGSSHALPPQAQRG